MYDTELVVKTSFCLFNFLCVTKNVIVNKWVKGLPLKFQVLSKSHNHGANPEIGRQIFLH